MKKLSRSILNYVSTKTRGKYDEAMIVAERLRCGSNNKTAEVLGIPRRTVDRTMHRVMDRAMREGETGIVHEPKIAIIDIETAPILSYIWSIWKPAFGTNMMERGSYVLSWAAKWLGEDEVFCDALCYQTGYDPANEDDSQMLEGIWNILDEADFVVAHNGDKFDIKRLNTRFLLAGMRPPSPFKQIDTLKMVKRCFAFDSNRLEHLLQEMYGFGKDDSGGFDTWRGCMQGDMEAWDKLLQYNKTDVTKLEKLYIDIRSWDKSHPNAATHAEASDVPTCVSCSSENVSPTGKAVSTNASKYDGYVCNDCGTQMRGRKSILSPTERDNLLVRAR